MNAILFACDADEGIEEVITRVFGTLTNLLTVHARSIQISPSLKPLVKWQEHLVINVLSGMNQVSCWVAICSVKLNRMSKKGNNNSAMTKIYNYQAHLVQGTWTGLQTGLWT